MPYSDEKGDDLEKNLSILQIVDQPKDPDDDLLQRDSYCYNLSKNNKKKADSQRLILQQGRYQLYNRLPQLLKKNTGQL